MPNNIPLLKSRMASADLTNMRNVPIWRARDTPLRSLYRIYEAMIAREYYAIGPEVEYFWYQNRWSWALQRLPDPCDEDPVRYALLSCIAEELARAFNWRLGLGMRRDRNKHVYRKTIDEELPPFTSETAPFWTRTVPAFAISSIVKLSGGISVEHIFNDWMYSLFSGPLLLPQIPQQCKSVIHIRPPPAMLHLVMNAPQLPFQRPLQRDSKTA
ncbi:hypothetical protein SI65_10144 [Aspergillus cristatus]|uniref:Uncharacterized protein n=1 Tax=Aspergillus cristatus TaxID=573508 RepID=A0A1E3B0G8_ASPCR|nr:hypothetical protein SI65_10144 [Aspergillus cristatus]